MRTSFVPGRQEHDLLEAVRRLYRKQAYSGLQKILPKIYPSDLARILESFPEDDAANLFVLITLPGIAASTLKQLSPDLQEYILKVTDYDKIIPILEQLPPDDRADIIRQLDPETAKRFMGGLDQEILREVEDLLQYPEDTAGGLMTSQFFALPESTTVREAIEAVHKVPYYEMVFYLYVLDENERLVGVSSLRQLILADPDKTLGQIMNPRVVRVGTSTNQADIADLVKRYRLLAVPVVDDMDALVGIVTVDDVIDAIEQEVSDDMLKMAGSHSAAEEIASQTFFQTLWRRRPWLIAALGGGLIASGIIDYYFHNLLGEGLMSHAPAELALLAMVLAMTAFLPIVMGLSSNVGTVSATVTVHGLTTGAIKLEQSLSLLLKELGTGVLLGVCYGGISGLVTWLMFNDIRGGTIVSQIVGITVCANIGLASLIGPGLPMLFQKWRNDPTVVTGPYLSSLLDVLAIINYFLIAELLLPV